MKKFRYKAKKGPDEVLEGEITAATRDEAVDKINELGLLPIDIAEAAAPAKTRGAVAKKSPLRPRIKSRELISIYRQLGKLIRAGVPILRALSILTEEATGDGMRQILESLRREVREGNNLSAAMGHFPKVFSAFDLGMIQTGEIAGKLDEVLSKIAYYHDNQGRLRSKVRTAMVYPGLVTLLGIGTVWYMLGYVIPKFSRFFRDLGQDLPVPTKILIGLSEWTQDYGLFVVGGVCVAAFLVKLVLRNPGRRAGWHRMLLAVPKFGTVLLKSEVARLCRTLELLLKSGIPILNSMRIAIPVVRNEAMREELASCYKILEDGSYLSAGLKQSRIFPSMMTHMVSLGEESGKLDEALGDLADWYEKDTEETIQIMMNLLEPLIILVVGLILTFIIVAVLLPVFSINAMVT